MVTEQNVCIYIPAPSLVLYSHRLFRIGTRSEGSFLLPAETRHGADCAMDVVSAVPPACGALPPVLHGPQRSHSFPISPTGYVNCLLFTEWSQQHQPKSPAATQDACPVESGGPRPHSVPTSVSPPKSAEWHTCTLTVSVALWGREDKVNDRREIWQRYPFWLFHRSTSRELNMYFKAFFSSLSRLISYAYKSS